MTVALDQIAEAYDALAPGYDLFTSGHDHTAWAELVEGLALRDGLSGRRLLDVGCGTGSGIAPMLERGYQVTGIDISRRMLAIARDKVGADIPLHVGDMRALEQLGEFDLVWSLCDAVNYLLTDEELVAAFEGFRRNLAAGGVVAFDVDTLATFRALYSSLVVVPGEDRVVMFEGKCREPLESGAEVEAWVDCLERRAPPWWERVRCVHRQRHHPRAELERALAAAGLACAGVWGTDGAGGLEQPLDELRHSKAVYIAHAEGR